MVLRPLMATSIPTGDTEGKGSVDVEMTRNVVAMVDEM